jgi:carbon monoxide dehydrogenase subunit G
MSFSRDVVVPGRREDVWATVTDVNILASWISLLGDVTVVSPMEQYSTRLHDRIGRFSVTADLDVRVTEYVEPEYVVVTMQGEDRQVSSRIAVKARLDLAPSADDLGTDVKVVGEYEVTGTVATLGAGSIRKKAQKIIEDFFGNMEGHFS